MRQYIAVALMLAGCARKQPETGVKVDPALAMLVPAVGDFDIALGRTSAIQG